ncbi:ABC transporter substrate-binding protein [Deinococcus sp.]|uniref:ABC transporter substrate-binding protein n=1 Tax=Deinococcus sp. TaxID=47478 RepID=UPI003C7EC4BD
MKKIPLTVVLSAALLGQVLAQSTGVEIYNDKANWNPFYNQMGALGAKSGAPFKGVTFADTSSYQAAVRTSLGSNKAPPMFTWWSGYRMKDLVDTGMVEDLTALWTKYEKSGEYSPDAAKAFTFNGKVYAIPNNVAYWAVFYNKKAYADAGITVPKTWAQLEANNAKLKAKNVTAFGQTVDGRWPAFIWFSEFLIRQDPDFYERLVAGKAKYTDPQVTKTFGTWKSWIDKGYLSSPSVTFGTSGGNGMAKLFAQGKIANILVGDWYASTLQEAGLKPGSDYGMFILPNMSAAARPAVIFEAAPILVSKNSAVKADALKVADFWMSASAQKVWVDLQSFTPVNKKVQADNPVTAGLSQEITGRNYRLINRIWEATPTEIIEPAVDELGKFMLDPTTGSQTQANIQKLADAYWNKK